MPSSLFLVKVNITTCVCTYTSLKKIHEKVQLAIKDSLLTLSFTLLVTINLDSSKDSIYWNKVFPELSKCANAKPSKTSRGTG